MTDVCKKPIESSQCCIINFASFTILNPDSVWVKSNFLSDHGLKFSKTKNRAINFAQKLAIKSKKNFSKNLGKVIN